MPRGTSGNGQDTEEAQKLLLRQLQRLEPKQRLEALISAPKARELIQSLPPEALYLDIQSVGLADTTDIVQLASPAQFQAFVDLGAWKADRLDHQALLRWLRAARGSNADRFRAQVAGLDLELIESLLRTHTTIHDLEEEPDLHVEGLTLDSADSRYRVEFLAEKSSDQAALRALLLDFMAADALGLSRLLGVRPLGPPQRARGVGLRVSQRAARGPRLSGCGDGEVPVRARPAAGAACGREGLGAGPTDAARRPPGQRPRRPHRR